MCHVINKVHLFFWYGCNPDSKHLHFSQIFAMSWVWLRANMGIVISLIESALELWNL
jgi:hypothetical protein